MPDLGGLIVPGGVGGQVSSGELTSGSVFGFFGPVRHIASGSVGVWDFGSGAVVAGSIGSGAVQSGNIASGQIGSEHIADGLVIQVDIGSGAVGSGALASGSVSRFKMASGAINSGQVGSGAVLGQNAGGAFCIASGSINFLDIADAGIGSGNISSGHVAWPHLSSGCIRSGHVASGAVTGQAGGGAFCVASGTVARFDLGSGSVWSGHVTSGGIWGLVGSLPHIASGSMTGFELGSGSIVSGRIASGQVGNFHIASGQVQGLAGAGVPNVASGTINAFNHSSGSVLSGHVGSGTIWGLVGSLPHISSGSFTGFELGSGSIVSGRVASGQLGNFHFASGTKVDVSEWTYDDNFTAGEILSGASTGIAVAFTQSGILQTAMASVSGRMPAVGVVTANVASGGTVTMYRGGRLFNAAFNFSGWMNRPVYVGRSGQLSASGAPTSSGDIQQVMGISCNQSGLQVQIGDALEEVVAASGDVGSGSITGQGIGGYFCIASGTLSSYDLASGTTVPRAQNVTPIYSGSLWNSGLITGEAISGIRAVTISQSGTLLIAMAAVSGRMPAIGVVKDNVLSGLQANVYTDGLILCTSGLADMSGFISRRVWVNRSGEVVSMSGGFGSGGWASGDLGQPLGVAANNTSGTASGSFVLLNVHPIEWSGGPLGVAAGGTF